MTYFDADNGTVIRKQHSSPTLLIENTEDGTTNTRRNLPVETIEQKAERLNRWAKYFDLPWRVSIVNGRCTTSY